MIDCRPSHGFQLKDENASSTLPISFEEIGYGRHKKTTKQERKKGACHGIATTMVEAR
jgi:hypothetical protein